MSDHHDKLLPIQKLREVFEENLPDSEMRYLVSKILETSRERRYQIISVENVLDDLLSTNCGLLVLCLVNADILQLRLCLDYYLQTFQQVWDSEMAARTFSVDGPVASRDACGVLQRSFLQAQHSESALNAGHVFVEASRLAKQIYDSSGDNTHYGQFLQSARVQVKALQQVCSKNGLLQAYVKKFGVYLDSPVLNTHLSKLRLKLDEGLGFFVNVPENEIDAVRSSTRYITYLQELRAVTDAICALGDAAEPNREAAMADSRSSSAIALDFKTDLTERAASGKTDPLIGREKEVLRLAQILRRRKKNNPVLVGEAGVGKTAIVEGFARELALHPEKYGFSEKTRLFAVSIGNLVAGTKFRGDFEEKLKALITEAEQNPDYIYFFDEIHTLVGAGNASASALDASNILKPALANGTFKCIGATTRSEFRKSIKPDEALRRRFMQVEVDEPSQEETLEILKGARNTYETFHQVVLSDEILQYVIRLAAKHIHDNYFPDKAFDILDECGSKVLPELKSATKPYVVTEADIEQTVSSVAKIIVEKKSLTGLAQLQKLRDHLHENVFGQEEALDAVLRAVKKQLSGLHGSDRPVGSFLCLGPTGVGKTELALQLAAALEIPLFRYDMSEYMEKHSVAKLIGAPPGYVGFDQEGFLSKDLSKARKCVFLFDEIEKAHPDLKTIFLQVLEKAIATDSTGQKLHFDQAYIFMTSNKTSEALASAPIGFVSSPKKASTTETIRDFSPEFINRFDRVLHFRSLPADVVAKIIDKLVAECNVFLSSQQLTVEISPKARLALQNAGYSRVFGGREMKRAFDNLKSAQLPDAILEKAPEPGSILYLDLPDGKALPTSIEDLSSLIVTVFQNRESFLQRDAKTRELAELQR